MSDEKKKTEPVYAVRHVTFARGVWFPDTNNSTLTAWERGVNADVACVVHGGGSVTLTGPRGRVTVPAAHVLSIREEPVTP